MSEQMIYADESADIATILATINVLNERCTAVALGDTPIYDANGELVGTIRKATNGYALHYPDPDPA